jgi:nitroimidazol reductase NimA-like FMN-containing flavoprotein (pyridoxamine 5'-phosphate oxidase superfamily)
MRRPEKALTETAAIEAILRRGRLCQLAFTAEPAPYIVTLNYGYDEGALYFHSALEGRKIELARQGQRIGFSVALELELVEAERACGWTTRFQSVVGYGRLEFMATPQEKRLGLDRFMSHYTHESCSYPDKMIAKTAVYRLVIEELSAKQSRAEE